MTDNIPETHAKAQNGREAVLKQTNGLVAVVINTNLAASNGRRSLADSTDRLNESLSPLASGSKLINPQDEAVGMAEVTKFDAAISRNKAVQDNVTNALSFGQPQCPIFRSSFSTASRP